MPRKKIVYALEDEASGLDVDLDALVRDHALVYHDHVRKEARRADGTIGPVWFATERPATGADVLGWRHDEGDVHVVLGDGQRWRFSAGGNAYQLLEE